MASKLMDPVANAGTIGFLFMLMALVQVLSVAKDFTPLAVISIVLYAVIGFGLWKKKVWALYAFGCLAALSVFVFLFNLMQVVPFLLASLVDPILTVGLFLWFWSARERFNK